MKTSYSITIAAAALVLGGCTVGPDYKRPQVAVPASFRAPETLPDSQAASLADLKWFEVFRDPQLQALIKASLTQNYDLRDAVARVDEARANLGITRSNQYPQVSASGNLQFTRLSRNGQFPLPASFVSDQNRNWGEAMLNLLSFQIDLWGQLRRATEGARANLLSADWNRKTVITTVVSQVAADYFQLLQLDSELEISRSTLATRRESLRLTIDRQAHGIATLLDVRQAEQLVDSAAESIPQIEQQIGQTEDQISLLLGKNPGNIERARTFTADYVPPEVPAGLPSALLERRPDIRAAEQAMIAANADIGVAKAEYFPQISLTGSIGGQSSSLATLFSGPASAWSFVPQLTQPIFTAGRLKNNVRLFPGTGLDLAAPLKFNHAANLPFSDRGTGISFAPATAFAHSSNEPVQPLSTGITLDRPAEEGARDRRRGPGCRGHHCGLSGDSGAQSVVRRPGAIRDGRQYGFA